MSRPTIFVSPEGGDKNWRLMEKLAAILEITITPDSEELFTFTSAKVPDCISSSEQVDAAFSYVPDPTQFFSFMGVRDRNKNIGRGYIQEIIGKRKSLGCHECCVVSTKGFSPDALKLAAHEKINVRCLDNMGDQKSKFFALSEFEIKKHIPDIIKCEVIAYDPKRRRTGTFVSKGSEVFCKKLLFVDKEGKRSGLPLLQPLDRILSNGGWHQLENAENHNITLVFTVDSQRLKLSYIEDISEICRELDVKEIRYVVRGQIETALLPRGDTYYYRDAISGKLLAEAVLFVTNKSRETVCLTRTLSSPHRANAVAFLNEKELGTLIL